MRVLNNHIFSGGRYTPDLDHFTEDVYRKEEYDKEICIRNHFTTDPDYAYEVLFKKHYQVLCHFAVRYVDSIQLAEDIVGDVFYKIWEKKVYLNIRTSYKSYLFAAVRNRSLNYLKKECTRFRKTSDWITNEPDLSNDPCDIIIGKELNALVKKSFLLLPPRCQRVFILSRFEGRKNREIAFELNISVKAVEAQISKALAIIKNALQQKDFFNE